MELRDFGHDYGRGHIQFQFSADSSPKDPVRKYRHGRDELRMLVSSLAMGETPP
jgi:hypothetical protein